MVAGYIDVADLDKHREVFERSKELILTPQKYEELFGIKVDGLIESLDDEELEIEQEQRYLEKYMRTQ